MSVGQDGYVVRARDTKSTLPSAPAIACMVDAMGRCRLEPPGGDREVTLTLPFTFDPR
jgi:hypothetical protein